MCRYGNTAVNSFQNLKTKGEIEDLARAGDEATLKALLGSRMNFGTAGLIAL